MTTRTTFGLIMLLATGIALAPLAAHTGLAPERPQEQPRRGIEGKEAPAWSVDEWINLPAGTERIDIDDFRGKVLYLYCFQSWCPGCHSRGFPTLQQLIEHYHGADDVAFVAVQTVFEGFQANTVNTAWKTAARYDLDIPVGHSGTGGKRSVLMNRYRTGGTPWTIIVDRNGIVRYNAFHAAPERAVRIIDMLRREAAPPAVTTLPAARGGQSIVGKKLPRLSFDEGPAPAAPAAPAAPGSAAPKPHATLYRWWTDNCRFCASSLPGIERLRALYGDEGLAVVGVYHPKPAGAVDRDAVRADAKRLGYGGPIAVDADWSELKRVFPEGDRPPATSVTVLVDRAGVVRFVHPGPELYPSADPRSATQNADYRLLERAVKALLREAP